MKKTLIALLALAGVAAAGTEETITLQPAPQTACTWQPEFSLEYVYSLAEEHDEVDTQGVRAGIGMTLKTASAFSHSFCIEFSHEEGNMTDASEGILCKLHEHKNMVTLGYDLNYALTDKVTLFVGARAGYATTDFDIKAPAFGYTMDVDLDGFTYSVGGGVKYQITESINVKAGYEFNRYYYGDFAGMKNIIPNMHVFSVGVGYQF